MANTALIKRSSVANKAPTTSDLSLGELAVNTYDGKLFLKKSVGGTESIVDLTNADKLDGQDGSYYTGYTDTAIANLIDSAPNALNTLNELSAALNDDASFSTTVTNSIATKLPLAGGTLTGNLTISNNNPEIVLQDTGDNPNFKIENADGVFVVRDTSNSTNRFTIGSTGTVNVAGNLDVGAGIDVTGTCTATTFSGSGASLTNIPAAQLTGVLPAIDGSNLTGIVASGQNANTLDNLDSTQFVRSDVDDSLSGLYTFTSTNPNTPRIHINGISGSGGYNFLLRGSNDGGSRAVHFVNGTTRSADGGTNTYTIRNDGGALRLGRNTFSTLIVGSGDLTYNGNKVFQAANDGSGSGLDSDTVDGIQASSFLRSDVGDTYAGGVLNIRTNSSSGHYWGFNIEYDSGWKYLTTGGYGWAFRNGGSNGFEVRVATAAGTADASATLKTFIFKPDGTLNIDGGTAFHTGNDGSGSGLDSDTVDGLQASQFLRSDTTDTFTGNEFTFSSSANQKIILQGATNPYIRFKEGTTNKAYIQWSSAGYFQFVNQESGEILRIKDGNDGLIYDVGGTENKVFHAGNDGAGSGLDSDTVDGIQASSFLRSDAVDTANENITFSSGKGIRLSHSNQVNSDDGRIAAGAHASGLNIVGTRTLTSGNRQVRIWGDVLTDVGSTFWNAGNDGSGSGLDSDKFDGLDSVTFLRQQGDVAGTANWNDYIDGTEAGWRTVLNHGSSSNQPSSSYGYGTVLSFSKAGQAKFQLYAPETASGGGNTSNRLYYRTGWNTNYRAWVRLLDSSDTGSGNGLDADKLDGQDGSYYLDYNNFSNTPTIPSAVTNNNQLTNGAGYITSADGGNAATVGTLSASQFIRSDDSDSITKGSMWVLTNSIADWGFRFSNGNATQGHVYMSHGLYGMHIRNDSSTTSHYLLDVYASNGNRLQVRGGDAYTTIAGNAVWHAGNDGSGSGLSADNVDGLDVHTGRNNEANKIVRTDGNGYLQAGYINTSSANDTGNGLDCKFYASEDDYIRYIDLRSMRAVMNTSARSSAFQGREQFNSNQDYWVGSAGWGADNFDSTVWDYGSCFFDVWSNPSGQPSGTSHWTGVQAMHYTNASARYGMRITVGAGQPSLAYIQGRWNTTTYGWNKLWNGANDGSGSGLDADTVRGWIGFPSGTLMLFHQTSAPTGWTKRTSHNNKALRVVTGTVGSGGSTTFANAFNANRATSGGSVSNHTLTTAQMPSHTHTGKATNHDQNNSSSQGWPAGNNHNSHRTSDRGRTHNMHSAAHANTGSSNSHSHGFTNPSFNLNVQYVDVIIASKD